MTKPRHVATPSHFMTVAEVANYLRVHQSTIYRLVRKRQLPVFTVGSDYRFDKEAIDKWMTDEQVKV
jgi:excisionase family DNA binding protein